jgi:hypothetical protein
MFDSLVNVEVIRFVAEVEIVNVFGGRSSVVENSVFFVCPVVVCGFFSVGLSFLFVTSGGDVMSIGEGGFTDSVFFVDFVAVNDVARDAVVLSSEDWFDLVEPCLVVVFFEELSTVDCPDSIEVGIGVLWVCVGVTSCCVFFERFIERDNSFPMIVKLFPDCFIPFFSPNVQRFFPVESE